MADRRVTAVDHQLLPEDEVGRGARQEDDGVRNLLGLAEAARRKLVHVVAAEDRILGELTRHVRDAERRSDGVDVDAVLAPLRGERAGHEEQSALGRAVGREEREADVGQIELMLTILPPPPRLMKCLPTACAQKNGALRFVSSVRSQSSSDRSSAGASSCTPALLTRMCRSPKSETTSATKE